MVAASKVSFEESLEQVILNQDCLGCAACVISCPLRILDYVEGTPRLDGECTSCGICAKICPRYDSSESALEKFVFRRERMEEEEFGIYNRLVIARTKDKQVLDSCQDGGVVTTLIRAGLKSGLINGAAVSGVSEEKPFYPVPRLVLTPQEVLACAGTRYTYSPNMIALGEGVRSRDAKLAFVGTPCQVSAARKMQMLPLKRYVRSLQFIIGLMCTETFTYEGLMEQHVQDVLGIDLRNVKKMNIKGRIMITTNSNEVKTIPLKVAKKYTRKACDTCTDFSAEVADISVGGLGMNGWTFTILRTQKGEEVFAIAEKEGLLETRPVEEAKAAFDLLIRLSQTKRRNRYK